MQGVGKVADRRAAGRRKRIPGAARSFFHHLARARSSAPQQGLVSLQGAERRRIAFAVVFALSGGALRGGWTSPLRFSLACLDFSFLFRGVQRGYFSFQRERSEIMKADEPLISAKELPYRSRFPLADHGSMRDSAILHEVSPARPMRWPSKASIPRCAHSQ